MANNLIITGNTNPEIGKEIHYSIFQHAPNFTVENPLFLNSVEKAEWQVLILEHGKWRKTSENTKKGDNISYTFTQNSLWREGIKLVVTKGNDKGELIIKTRKAGQPKILKIDLLDVNYNKVTKPLHYFDILIARAQCTEMEGEKLHFTLWEDDALKSGHNKINEINRINPVPIPATVKRGKAEVKFNMAFYTQASMIANMQLAKGDKSEGKNHEYYVTADYYGKLEASNNVNIKVDSSSLTPVSMEDILKKIEEDKVQKQKDTQKPKVNKRPTPPPPTPKKDTYKTPITPKAKTKASDPKGKIISVEFVDFLGKPYQNMKFGTQVKAKIISKDMKGKTIKLKIWEDDISDQLVYENNYVLGGDESYATINLTNEMRKKGDDFKEGSEQEYFLEIEYAGQSVDSEVINVNDSAPKIKVETGVSTSGVKAKKADQKKEEKKSNGKCSCNNNITKEELKNIAPYAKVTNIDKYFEGFNITFKKFNINTCLQKIHFFAQVIHESGSFRYNVEQGNSEYLAKYGGWHGRGLIQLTTKPNYLAFERAIGEDVTSSSLARDKVTKSPYAVYSAGWFWDKHAILNTHAESNDFIYITYRVNGGFNHIDDRLENVKRGFKILYSNCVNNDGKTTEYKFKSSKTYEDKKASFAWGLWHDPKFSKDGCRKSKHLALEGYKRFVELTDEADSTTNYYSIQKLIHFSDLVYTKTIAGKVKKFVNIRKASLKRIKELENE
ncbi:hypothetical protein A0O34_08665 [Chryseobacterium glaciei]|uniref:Glycoside hydrolase family 19 catalytic domain-containing protein n=1 Tax=Chryseobacterium glaciei TaxID=1685010 RepID=A0A172XU88_9FLAO|nr:hypothetical protein [Chryseobacterium glaciei]ANF50589.1 hypothetical protein A0O34_08665 [Chryseobacterium glaciei]